jgi:hypothetical protein
VQAFTNYSPRVFSQNPHAPVPCAHLECTAVLPFNQTVVWGWLNGAERNFRAFCCHACALEALPHQYYDGAWGCPVSTARNTGANGSN